MSRPRNNDCKIAGLYDLEDTLGRGHFAVVKLARHVFTGEKVAVKVIDKTKLDEVSRAHLFQEVRCMKLVQHPNVVRLYEVIDTQTKLYLILELGDGGDMYDYIMKHEKGLDEEMAKKYFRQIVSAISYCHKLHVVHRDLKPENVVFFEKLGMVKLTDFGFSNKFCPGQKLETSCGSLAYSAPEILLGDSYDAPAVDVWSLGVILYMLVTGYAPFQEANDSETLTMIMDCRYTVPPDISQGCRSLIETMLIRDPEKRASLEEIASDPWLCFGQEMLQPADYLPLVSRESLPEEDHQHIIQKLVSGGIATKEEILEALDKNSYNHITATYFLLAERKLRQQRQEQAQLINLASQSKSDLSALAISPRSSTNPVLPHPNTLTVESLLSPHDTNRLTAATSPVMCSLELPQAYRGIRKCSVVEEEDEDACSEKSEKNSLGGGGGSVCGSVCGSGGAGGGGSVCGSGDKTASSPSLSRDLKLELKDSSGNNSVISSRSSSASSSPCQSPSRIAAAASVATVGSGGTTSWSSPSKVTLSNSSKYKTLPSPSRKLHSVRSSPQLTLNEIYEEGELDLEAGLTIGPGGNATTSSSSGNQRIARSRILLTHQSIASPEMLRKYEQRRQYPKPRTASCSSSDASDDDSAESRKRKNQKLKDIPKRDSHDDSSDNQDRHNNGGGGSNTGGGGTGTQDHRNHSSNTSSPPPKKDSKSDSGSNSNNSKTRRNYYSYSGSGNGHHRNHCFTIHNKDDGQFTAVMDGSKKPSDLSLTKNLSSVGNSLTENPTYNRVFCKSASSPLNAYLVGAGHRQDSLTAGSDFRSPDDGSGFTVEVVAKGSLSEPSSPVLRADHVIGKENNKLQASLNLLNLSSKDRVAPSCSTRSRSSLGIGRIIKQAPRYVSKRLDINQNGVKKKGGSSSNGGSSGGGGSRERCKSADMMLVQSSSTSKCCSLC